MNSSEYNTTVLKEQGFYNKNQAWSLTNFVRKGNTMTLKASSKIPEDILYEYNDGSLSKLHNIIYATTDPGKFKVNQHEYTIINSKIYKNMSATFWLAKSEKRKETPKQAISGLAKKLG